MQIQSRASPRGVGQRERKSAEVEAVPMESDEEEDGAMVCVEAVQSYAR